MILAAMRNLLAEYQQLRGIIGVEGRDADAIKSAMDSAARIGRTLSAPLGHQAAETLRTIDTIAKAMNWMQRLTSDATKATAELAREDGIDDGEISRVLPLAFLAPDIVDAIVIGRQPVALTARYLKPLKPLPTSWSEQRRLLGFEPARST